MFPNGLRIITSEILKKNRINFNILWQNEKYAFIEIAKKPMIDYKKSKKHLEIDYSDIPDYDKDVNPFLL